MGEYIDCVLFYQSANDRYHSQEELQARILRHEHIYEQIAVPSCHVSTILKLKDGTLLAAWFAGQQERSLDVTIWFSRKVNGVWEPL